MADVIEKIGLNRENFTKTEKNILRLLGDGKRHHKLDVKKVLFDDQVLDNSLAKYMTIIRRKVADQGLMLLCVYHNRSFFYQLVRSLDVE